jgi:SAM-dependent methyltransferase
MKSAAALALSTALLLATPVLAMEEVPFVVTPDNVTLAMLTQARVGPGDYVIDLGSGDGRIVIVAAKRFGARGLGVEIVPDLVKKSRESAQRAGVSDRAEFREQDLFKTDLSPATVVTLYLLPEVNLQLRPTLLGLRPGTRIVSHDWDMGDWKPDRTVTVAAPDKTIGREKSSQVHYWTVPAKVDGLWCGAGSARDASLRLTQNFQELEAELKRAETAQVFRGRLEGATLRAVDEPGLAFGMQLEGDRLKVTSARGALASLKGAAFRRASGACARQAGASEGDLR